MNTKKIFVLLLSMFLLFCIIAPVNAKNDLSDDFSSKIILSTMSENECIDFVKKSGVEIPEDFAQQDWLGEFIKKAICVVENDPSYEFVYNYTVSLDFSNAIKNAVNNYYGLTNRSASNLKKFETLASYTLQDSIVYGSWSESFLNYNCYGYALGRTDILRNPGYFSSGTFSIDLSILDMAILVKNDLKTTTFSKNCVQITTTRPTSAGTGETVICIRKGTDDYHLMKLFGSSWRHKTGQRAILQYKYMPTTSMYWTNENSLRGIAYAGTLTYTSNINYIIYKSNHNTTYKWTGEESHFGNKHRFKYADVCNDCEEATNINWVTIACSGPPCDLPL